jgi:putative membrane protein
MTVLAPLLASWMQRCRWPFPGAAIPWFLPLVTIAQLALFFVWHSPQVLIWMMASPLLHSLLQGVLLLVATAFWSSVLQRSGGSVWSAVVALLVTGKLFCLVALILVFAPRALYGGTTLHHAGMDLADQQLAGLLMITACPMTYILAAILLVARWLRLLGDEPQERRA